MHTWLILGSAVGFGLAPTLVQILLQHQFSAEAIALFRFGIPFLLVLPHLRHLRRFRMEALRTAVVGAVSAIGMVVYFTLFRHMPATSLILVYYTYPLFAIVLGCLFFEVPATRNRFIAAALIVLAVFMTLETTGPEPVSGWLWLAAFLPPLSFALLLNYFARPIEPLPTGARMSAALIGHMLVLLPLIVWVQPDKLMPESASDWLWISALGLLSAAIPQYLFARGSVQAGVESTTSIGSTEVIFAMALSAVFLGDDLTRAQYLAAAMIVMSSLIRLEETGTDRKSDGSNKSILGSR